MTQNGRRSRRRDLNGFRLPSRHSCNAFSLHRVLLLTLPILHVACSREAPEVERLYVIEGTLLHYNSGVYRASVSDDGAVQAQPEGVCSSPSGPSFMPAVERHPVRIRPGAPLTVAVVGGCEFDADEREGVLTARNVSCRLSPEGELAQLGVLSREYSEWTLDTRTHEFRASYRSTRDTTTGITQNCTVAHGTARRLPEAE